MKKTKLQMVLSLALLAPLSINTAQAHHSFAAYDQTRTVTVTGVVKEVRWVNPHTGFVLTVEEDGQPVDYLLAGGSIPQHIKTGWYQTSLEVGDTATFTFHPLKDGSKGGEYTEVLAADGSKIGGATSKGVASTPAEAAPAVEEPGFFDSIAAWFADEPEYPDWSGVWKTESSGLLSIMGPTKKQDLEVPYDQPPYKPEWQKRYMEMIELAAHQGSSLQEIPFVDSYTKICNAGVPRNISNGFNRFFIISPEMVWFINGGEVRYIYTDGRDFPPDQEMYERVQGWSIGHWEDDTLVVETRHMKSDLWGSTQPLYFSDQMVFHERYRMTDMNTIVNDVTIIDPVAFTQPWKFQREYKKQDFSAWAIEKEICGGDDDFQQVIDGRLQLVPGS